MKKIKIGIDINEILRARWLQFDKYYVQEFDLEGVPADQPYVYDFFKYYKWKDTVEVIKELKEPEDMPDDINPLDYQHNEELGEANADIFLFKAPEEKHLTAREVYNRFMYEDFVFEIFGLATMMYKNMDLDVNVFYERYNNNAEFIIVSKENQFSIPSTLSFLSKIRSRFNNYRFAESNDEILKDLDILITTDPELLDSGFKKIIKLLRPYNESSYNGLIKPVLQINDLINNIEFEKIIKFKNK